VAVSGLMGSVDAVWLYVFVMDFLNSLARDVHNCCARVGYSLLRINRNNNKYPIGFAVDHIASPRRLKVLHVLASDASIHFDDNYVKIVNCLTVKGHQ
jgi:hypothetical protein